MSLITKPNKTVKWDALPVGGFEVQIFIKVWRLRLSSQRRRAPYRNVRLSKVQTVGFGLSSSASVVAGIGKLGGAAQSDAFASCAVWLRGFVQRWCPRTTQAANSVFV